MDRNSLNHRCYLQGLEQDGMCVHAGLGRGVWGRGRAEIWGVFSSSLSGSSAFDSMWGWCSVAAELGILYTLSGGWMGMEEWARVCLETPWPGGGPALCHSPEHICGSGQCCALAHLSQKYNSFFSIDLNCSWVLIKVLPPPQTPPWLLSLSCFPLFWIREASENIRARGTSELSSC